MQRGQSDVGRVQSLVLTAPELAAKCKLNAMLSFEVLSRDLKRSSAA